jgi:hypothetical protein
MPGVEFIQLFFERSKLVLVEADGGWVRQSDRKPAVAGNLSAYIIAFAAHGSFLVMRERAPLSCRNKFSSGRTPTARIRALRQCTACFPTKIAHPYQAAVDAVAWHSSAANATELKGEAHQDGSAYPS